jgi:cytochrome c-type protein NapC
MPDTPDAETIGSSPVAQQLDISNGLTKYIKESRSKIEVKGRRGKDRGGWDKLKSAEDLKGAAESGHFMDIVRYKSGNKEVEDGHILEQRVMSGGQGAEFTAELNSGTWSLVMKRKLNSDKPGDLSLETDKIYNFGFAIHDDFSAARFHHVSLGYKLGFDNDDKGVEINAMTQ